MTREKQDLAFWVRFTEVNCQLNTGHTRHHDIANEESRSQLDDYGDSLLRMIECTCLKTSLVQDNAECWCRAALSLNFSHQEADLGKGI
jgi:hypothetical protein